jgi:hypothetical protein
MEQQPAPAQGDSDQMQAALAAAVDATGQVWIVAGYTDLSAGNGSSMGLSIRAPDGAWSAVSPLAPDGDAFRPSGDGWLASARYGGRAYYVSLLQTADAAQGADEAGNGIALAVVDVTSGTPAILQPRRIDVGGWSQWDEPTVSATRPAGAIVDTVIVAGTPIGPQLQDVIAVLVSRDGGESFQEVALVHAPSYPGPAARGPANTLVRPLLQQDPRAGMECHAYLAFGVYYATGLASAPGVLPPACQARTGGCRSIAETETYDCGASWDPPRFIAVDTGSTGSEDFRGFSYGVAAEGTRYVMFGDDTAVNAPVLLKRAAPGSSFSVVAGGRWDDGPMETIASGPGASGEAVVRWGPVLAASDRIAALWVEEDATSERSALWMRTSDPAVASWIAPQRVDDAGVTCDQATFPSDDYMAVVPDGPFGGPSSTFVVAWAPFVPCGSNTPRRIRFDGIR